MTRLNKALVSWGISVAVFAAPTASLGATLCGQKLGQTMYSAAFEWKNPSWGQSAKRAASRKSMRLVIAQNRKPGFHDSMFSAMILSGNSCEAICRVQAVDVDAKSADLSCRSSGFGALSAPATVFFGKNSTLRFGTWLQGYEQATLIVAVDRSAKLLQFSRKEPVKLARSR